MNNNHSNHYASWTWIIAVILALVLLWMFFSNIGSRSCCHDAANAPVAATTDSEETSAPVVTEAFSFSASADDFVSSGDASNIVWVANTDALKDLLNPDLTVEGDAQTIALLGSVNSEQEKQQKSLDAQVFLALTLPLTTKSR